MYIYIYIQLSNPHMYMYISQMPLGSKSCGSISRFTVLLLQTYF